MLCRPLPPLITCNCQIVRSHIVASGAMTSLPL
uniref:Uncharacterized protein n=1 Tax=Anguilla anguilla TaxID=7936 RepID=A0A0E9P5U7_ANGAN